MNERIDIKGCAIDSALAIVNAGLSSVSPMGKLLGEILSPIVKDVIPNSFALYLSKREEDRMNLFYAKTLEKIQRNINENRTLRSDELYYSPTELKIPKAQELFDGLLQKVKIEHQSQKITFYSNFYSNLCFDETISLDHAFFLIQMIEKLSYRQFAVLKYMSDTHVVHSALWDARFKTIENLFRYYDFYAEYSDLYSMKLLSQSGSGYSLGMSDTKISIAGLKLVSLVELDAISDSDCIEIDKIINAINSIIDRNAV